jgi:anhydro-N-acetylmuramic acid kinase
MSHEVARASSSTTPGCETRRSRVIGLMSGTSFDAIDAAVADIELEGDVLHLRPLGSLSAPYDDDLREELAAALPPAPTTLETVCRLDTRIGQAFAELAAEAIDRFGPADLIASHGQTLFHWVDGGRVRGTLQVGQPAWIAERTGVPVVSDLRSRDVAAGGQGAPLVSLLDALLLADRPGVPAALNLGGIANVTILPRAARAAAAQGAGEIAAGCGEIAAGGGEIAAGGGEAAPIAFDVGPGNALIDAAARHFTGAPYDADGRLAAAGSVIPALLDRLLADPYYARPAPKSTGKEHFNAAYLADFLDHDAHDLLATLTRLTARTVAHATRGVTELVVSGGGVKNPSLMAALGEETDATVVTSDALGLPAQDKEAYAFAVLGFLTAHGLPGTLPSATGARHARVLGSLTPGVGGLTNLREAVPSPRALRLG